MSFKRTCDPNLRSGLCDWQCTKYAFEPTLFATNLYGPTRVKKFWHEPKKAVQNLYRALWHLCKITKLAEFHKRVKTCSPRTTLRSSFASATHLSPCFGTCPISKLPSFVQEMLHRIQLMQCGSEVPCLVEMCSGFFDNTHGVCPFCLVEFFVNCTL